MPTSTRDIDVRKICQISVRRMAHTLYNTHMCTSVRAAKSSASPKVATNKILCAARKVFCFCITPSKSNNGHNREHHWDRQWQFTCTMQKFRFYCVGVMGIFNFFSYFSGWMVGCFWMGWVFWLRCLILFVFTLTAIGDRKRIYSNTPHSTFHDKHKGQKYRAIAAAGGCQKVKNSFETPFVVLILGNAS